MAKRFYYQIMGETIGPVSGVELRDRALAGDVTPDSLVRVNEDGTWVVAARLKNLFDDRGRPMSHAPILSQGSQRNERDANPLTAARTGRVFISYRRNDGAYPAQSIYDALTTRFGKEAVFYDVDSIPMGMDFHGVLNDAVAKCDLLLAVIGDHWLDARDEAGNKRLENPNDFVRIEIEAALSRQIPVVPVLVGSAIVPRPQDVPPTMSGLSRRQATELRPGRTFRDDLERLVKGVANMLEDVTNRTA